MAAAKLSRERDLATAQGIKPAGFECTDSESPIITKTACAIKKKETTKKKREKEKKRLVTRMRRQVASRCM